MRGCENIKRRHSIPGIDHILTFPKTRSAIRSNRLLGFSDLWTLRVWDSVTAPA
jgi:hypothetical protein